MSPAVSLVHNELTKLTAAWLDRGSSAALTVGVVAPLAASMFGYPGRPIAPGILIAGVGLWTLAAVGLHYLARLMIRRLRP